MSLTPHARALLLLEPFNELMSAYLSHCDEEALRLGLAGVDEGTWTAEEMAASITSEFVEDDVLL